MMKTRITGFALLLLGCLSGQAGAMTVEEAMARAERAPEVAASRAGVEGTTAMREAAGRLPDPRLILSLEDVPLEGEARYRLDESKRMAGLMQEVPAAAKREAQRQQAEAALEADARAHDFARLMAKREACLAWLQLYFLERKEALLQRMAAEIRLRQGAATAALAGGGEAEAALESLFDQQGLDDERDLLRRDLRQARARLARWVGPLADSELASGALPPWVLAAPNVSNASNSAGRGDDKDESETITELAASRARIGMAEAEYRMAQADKHADWSVELGLGKDTMGNGMLMTRIGIALPFFTSTRQEPRIAAARSKLVQSEAEHALKRADVQLQRDALRAEEAALDARLARLDGETLPLLERKVALLEASFSAGRGSAAQLILAREKRLAAEMRVLDFQAERAAVRTQLHFLQQREGERHAHGQ